ncbi:IclR family transcriptional regulator [Pseudonocardia broussonetiae]|uniref:IclR family transcriptional regulator n=1 Tax=Pseudonocardia broussonetiae TaxID=2736640 RepID=UPI001557B3E2|nr:IclR family transcriptional regulator [Pseudonocardia broussonetiae]
MAGGAHEAGRSVLSRAVAVLGAFDQAHRELTASQIARRADLPLSTTHRLLVELADHDVVARRGDRWGVGGRIWSLGLLAPVQTGLRDVAAPFLHDVHATTRATVHLVVRQDTDALYLERVSGHTALPVVSRAGSLLPLHATGAGKVLLAHAPDGVQERVLGGHLQRWTPHTVVHPGRLRDQLRRVREQGHATTHEELVLGMSSVAVPVSRAPADGTPDVVAALGIVDPGVGRHRRRFLEVLQVAARGLGRRLGPP